MEKTGYLLVIMLFILTGCTSSRVIKRNANESLLSYQADLEKSVKLIERKSVALPDSVTWIRDRDDFVSMIEKYRDKNEVAGKKANSAFIGLTVTGATIGLAGGVYGVILSSKQSDQDAGDWVVSATSLVAGTITTLLGTLNFQKKSENANGCLNFLNITLLDFKAHWGPSQRPQTEADFKAYITAKEEVINRIREMNCLGLQNVSR